MTATLVEGFAIGYSITALIVLAIIAGTVISDRRRRNR